MDFFARQEKAHRRTRWLVIYFLMAVIVMVVAIYFVALLVFVGATESHSADTVSRTAHWFQPELLAAVTIGVVGTIGLGSAYKTMQLRGGGTTLALMLGGRRILPNTNDPLERRLVNVVEEMAIASGIAVPPVFVLDNEQSINAFAAGWAPDQAVVAVNRGTLEYLNRDELQGVVAHEFSHILNGDMRLNIRLIGLIHGIFILSLIGYYLMRSSSFRSRRSKDNGRAQLLILGLALYVVGLLGSVFGRLIQAAVSREREYLADASAVQFTRNPSGIAGALKKIGGLAYGSVVQSPEATTAAHIFFGTAVKHLRGGPFATHPPLVKRIQAIDPQFDGKFPRVDPSDTQSARFARAAPSAKPPRRASAMPNVTRIPGIGDAIPVDPVVVLAAAGAPTEDHIEYSQQVLEAVPSIVLDAAREPCEARAVAIMLLLDQDANIRNNQLQLVESKLGRPARNSVEKLWPFRSDIPPALVLPLMQILQGTLRDLTPDQFSTFRDLVQELVEADQKITVFEFVLQQMLVTKLAREIERHRREPPRYHSVKALRQDITILISALAHAGSDRREHVEAAMARGMAALNVDQAPQQVLPAEACHVGKLGPALARIARATPAVKERVLRAAIECVAADGKLTITESELLRAIADSIDVPLPPLPLTPTS